MRSAAASAGSGGNVAKGDYPFRHERYPFLGGVRARIISDGEIQTIDDLRVVNLSSSGCLIEHKPGLFDAHDALELSLLLSDGSERVVRATVVKDESRADRTSLDGARQNTPVAFSRLLARSEFFWEERFDREKPRDDVGTLIEHAERMLKTEEREAEKLINRGRLLVGSTSGLLGFVAIGLIVAGADFTLNLLPFEKQQKLFGYLSLAGTTGIAIGLLTCISAVIAFVVHDEEDSGVLNSRIDFGPIGRMYAATQPNIGSVSPSYIFLSILRHEKGLIGRFFFLYLFRHFWRGFFKGARDRIIWSWNRAKHGKFPAARWIACPLYWGLWFLGQIIATILPGTRLSRFVRRRIDDEYLSWIIRQSEQSFEWDAFIEAQMNESEKHKLVVRYSYRSERPTRPDQAHHPVLAQSTGYYLQFSEGFAEKWLGRATGAKNETEIREPVGTYFELDERTLLPSGPRFHEPTWRTFISTYFTAQQRRSKNWNLWFRVRRAERIFTFGILIIAGAFILTAISGELVRKFAQPVASVTATLDAETGTVTIKPLPPQDALESAAVRAEQGTNPVDATASDAQLQRGSEVPRSD